MIWILIGTKWRAAVERSTHLIINPSIMPTAICEVVNGLIGVLSLFWQLAYWYTKTFLDWACRYKEGHSQVIKVIGTNMVLLYVTDRFCYKKVKNNWIMNGIARNGAVVSVHRECRYIEGSVQASFTVV